MSAFLLQQIECCYYSFNLFHIKCAFSLKMASINNLCIKTYTCCVNVLYALEKDADFKLWTQNRLSWFCRLVNMFNKGAHFRTKHLKWILTLSYKKASIALAAERLYICLIKFRLFGNAFPHDNLLHESAFRRSKFTFD